MQATGIVLDVPMLLLLTATGTRDRHAHLSKSLLIVKGQVEVIKGGKDCLVPLMCQQMLQLLTDGSFARALRSAQAQKQRSIWVCFLVLLQLVVQP